MVSILQLVIFNNTQSCLWIVDSYCLMPKDSVGGVGGQEGRSGCLPGEEAQSLRCWVLLQILSQLSPGRLAVLHRLSGSAQILGHCGPRCIW